MSTLTVPVWIYHLNGDTTAYGAMTPEAAGKYAKLYGLSRGIFVDSISLQHTGHLLLNLNSALNPLMVKKLQEGEAVVDPITLESTEFSTQSRTGGVPPQLWGKIPGLKRNRPE